MLNISLEHSLKYAQEKKSVSHHMRNAWVFTSISQSMVNATKPITAGEPEKLVPILFSWYGRSF